MAMRQCPECGAPVDSSWRFCPACGEELVPGFFSEFFDEFNRTLGRMGGGLNQNFEMFDATPLFKENAGGFSVRVTRRSDRKEPEVEIRTFGNVKPEDVRRQLEEQSGIQASRSIPAARKAPVKEPQTKMTKEGDRVVVEMSLPGIGSLKEVDITKLESSIEVRAYGREQGYFKIIAIPEGAQVVGKSFSGAVLRLELAK